MTINEEKGEKTLVGEGHVIARVTGILSCTTSMASIHRDRTILPCSSALVDFGINSVLLGAKLGARPHPSRSCLHGA